MWPKLVIRHIREEKKFKIGQECLLLEQLWILTKKVKAILFPCFRSGSNPCIRRNKIWGGQNGGVLVYNGGDTLVSYEKEPLCGGATSNLQLTKNRTVSNVYFVCSLWFD